MASGVATLNPDQVELIVQSFFRSAAPWLPVSWRTRLYGTELVRIFIQGDAVHRVWGPS